MQENRQRHELKRKVKDEELLVNFETAKDKQMQVDWIECSLKTVCLPL